MPAAGSLTSTYPWVQRLHSHHGRCSARGSCAVMDRIWTAACFTNPAVCSDSSSRDPCSHHRVEMQGHKSHDLHGLQQPTSSRAREHGSNGTGTGPLLAIVSGGGSSRGQRRTPAKAEPAADAVGSAPPAPDVALHGARHVARPEEGGHVLVAVEHPDGHLRHSRGKQWQSRWPPHVHCWRW
jgi:hypothetical protein